MNNVSYHSNEQNEDDSNNLQQLVNNMINVLYSDSELLNWFVNYSPNIDNGYMFDNHPNMNKLSKLVEKDGHSGASFACCCRLSKTKIRMDQLHGFPLR